MASSESERIANEFMTGSAPAQTVDDDISGRIAQEFMTGRVEPVAQQRTPSGDDFGGRLDERLDPFLARRGEEIEQLRAGGGEVVMRSLQSAQGITTDPFASASRRAQNEPATVTAALDTALLGGRDELEGIGAGARQLGANIGEAVSSLFTGDDPEFGSISKAFEVGRQAQQQTQSQRIRELNPLRRGAAQAAGVGGLIALTPGATAATAGAGVLRTAGRTALIGATFGGAAGTLTSEGDLGGRLISGGVGAGAGAAIGGVLGLTLPLVGLVAGKFAQPRTFQGRPISRRERRATRQILDAFEADGISQADAVQRLAVWQTQGGEAAALVDIGGPAVERLARSLGSRMGRPATQLQTEVDRQLANQADNVAESLANTVSQRADYGVALAELNAQRQGVAAPLYERAFQESVSVTPTLRRLLQRPSMNRGLPRAQRLAGEEDTNLAQLGLAFDENGAMIVPAQINVRLLDFLKRGMDDELARFRDPTTLRLNLDQEGRAVNNTLRAFRNEIDQLSPAYAQARAAWAGPSENIEALNLGREIFMPRMTIDKLNGRLARMTAGEREYTRAGVVRAIGDAVAARPDRSNVIASFFNRERNRAKLRTVFDDPVAMENFEALMRRQMEQVGRSIRIQPNFGSQTQLRGADDLILNETAPTLAGELLAGRGIRGATGSLARTTARSLSNRQSLQRRELDNQRIFDLLFDRNNPLTPFSRLQRTQAGGRILGQAGQTGQQIGTDLSGRAAAAGTIGANQ